MGQVFMSRVIIAALEFDLRQRGAAPEDEQAHGSPRRLPAGAGAGPHQRRPVVQPGHRQHRDEGPPRGPEELQPRPGAQPAPQAGALQLGASHAGVW